MQIGMRTELFSSVLAMKLMLESLLPKLLAMKALKRGNTQPANRWMKMENLPSSSSITKRADATCTAVCCRCGASVVCGAIKDGNEWLVDGDSIPDNPDVWNPPDNQCRHEDLRPTYVNPSPCVVCGALPSVYPEDGPAYCEDHCPDHEYEHDKWRRGHFCKTCDRPAPEDFYRE